MTAQDVEAKLLSLVTGPFGSFTLSFNTENGYQTVEQRLKTKETDQLAVWVEEPDQFVWASDAERDKAIATNSMWELIWYPKGEVSSNCVAASSLEAVLDAATKVR